MPQRNSDRDWPDYFPEQRRRPEPYRDYGWEANQSALPQFRDPSVQDRSQGRSEPYRDYGWEPGQSVLPEWRDRSVHPGGPHQHVRERYGRGPAPREYDPPGPGHWEGEQPGATPPMAERGGYQEYNRRGYRDEFAAGEPASLTYEIWMLEGPYTGRGPRGYSRSDERICEDVCERLTRHGHLDAGEIEVTVENGEVMLEGTVDSRQAKRMAEDIVETVYGVKDVRNHLRLRRA